MQVITDRQKVLVAIGLLAGVTSSAFGALNVTTSNNANTLANAILGGGVTLNSASYSGGASASGTFINGNSAPLGFNSGIVLTTGAASVAGTGVNVLGNTGSDTGTGGDAYLSTLSGHTTFNATKLTLNFTISASNPGNLFFNFVFASEEYNEYSTSQFNDVFAFVLDGVNIGLLPDNTTRISVNTVNAGVNSAYFRNNRPGETLSNPGVAGPYGIEYDGMTTVLTASALGLTPGAHTIELAIADASDAAWDSAVFIQGGSFSTDPTPVVPEPSTVLAGALLLLPLGAKAVRILRKGRVQ